MKDSCWDALFDKLRKCMKAEKATVAVARRLLKVVYDTLETLNIYKEKGIAHFVDLQAKAALYQNANYHGLKAILIKNAKSTEKVIEQKV
jgi:transposase